MHEAGRVWRRQCEAAGHIKKLIKGDDEMYMLHYYLHRGITPEHILSLPSVNQMFYAASMELAFEEKKAFYESLNG